MRFDYVRRLEDPTQPENFLIEETEWQLVERFDPGLVYAEFQEMLERGPELLGNQGKAVKEDIAAEGVDASLALVEPSAPIAYVMHPPEETYGKLKPRVVFGLNGTEYELGLTDVGLEERVRREGVGAYRAEDLGLGASGPTLLTVSLAEAHRGWHTKVAAAVLPLPR